MKKYLSLFFLFVFAFAVAYALVNPTPARAADPIEQTVKKTASGFLPAGKILDIGGYAGDAVIAIAVTTSTKTVAYFSLPASTALTPRLNLRDWNVSSPGMLNGGFNCATSTTCYVTFTGGGTGKAVDVHYRPLQ